MPCAPSGCGSRGQEGNRSRELGREVGAIIRIRDHRKIPCHVDTSDEDRFDIVAMSRVASEGYPGIVMALYVFFKGGLEFDVLPIGAVLGHQGRPLFLGEFKRETGAGFQESGVKMRNAVRIGLDVSYGVVLTEAPRPAPVSLTVLVQR